MLATVTELYRELNRLSTSVNQNAAALSVGVSGGGGAAKKLLSAATRMPQPARDWAIALAQSSSTITVSGARTHLNASWQSGVLPLCRKALDNRYPIFKGGTADVTLNDFSRLFAPGGLIDGYFNTNLRPFVDTSTKPWRWQRVDNVDLGIPRAVLIEFERAAEIRDSLFGAGGSTPAVNFEIVPVDLDASSTQVLLEIEGQTVTYNHGPPRPVRLRWPGTNGPQQVRITFSPPIAGTPTTIKRDGPWAWFRLLDEAQVTQSSLTDRFNVTFEVGGRSATFELRANSVNNPFSLTSLEQFRCPGSL
jgi:type VI secretion system protein ImpL